MALLTAMMLESEWIVWNMIGCPQAYVIPAINGGMYPYMHLM